MDEFESLSHTAWTCKYHVVFIPTRTFHLMQLARILTSPHQIAAC